MADTFWEKDFLIMCSYMSQSADCFMHSGFLLHIISNYALQTLCGSPHKICREDGCKVYFTDGSWVICRFSGTEPLLRMAAEAETDEKAQSYIQTWKAFLSL